MKKLILFIHQLFCRHKYQYTEINHDGINTVECKWCGKRKIVKAFPLLALAFVMCGCDKHIENTFRVGTVNYDVIVIDDCEYLKSGTTLAHKGNCKYCQKRLENTIDSIIKNNK